MQKLLLDPQFGFTTNLPGEQQSPTPEPPNPNPNPKSAGERQTSPTPGNSDSLPICPGMGMARIYDAEPSARCSECPAPNSGRRSRSGEFNVVQRVNINVVDTVDCDENEWRASSMEIFNELQASIAQLDGAGRIGVPDSEEQEYTEYFVTFNVEDKAKIFSPNLRNIIIPDGNKLELRVDPAHNKRPRISSPIPSSVVESSHPSSGSLVAKPEAAVDTGVAWLLEKIEKCPGYTKFHSNRRKVLQNPDRVESWRFAAQVTATFHKTSWPAEISSTTTAIEKALCISTTSLNEAINMTPSSQFTGVMGPTGVQR
ncbi:hypothetical protein B0H13DRAFT_1909380 [Mycena leptocephala]|nr:hypothetical protein B0H13DRAFT_1909380 [Mycena leptocephala]